MTFTVTLTTGGERDLSRAFEATANRRALSRALRELERLLAADPLSAGESRESSVSRVDYVPPLGFTFDVVVDDALVFVTAVWLVR
jgi:hypothetical protein